MMKKLHKTKNLFIRNKNLEYDFRGKPIQHRNIRRKNPCPECGKVIQNTKMLTEHMIRVHEFETPDRKKKGKFCP